MPKLAANLSTLFKEFEFSDRFDAAAKAGFRAVEYQYAYDRSPEEVAARARKAGVEIVLHNMPRTASGQGEFGSACVPGLERQFRDDLERGIEYAQAAQCKRLHCMAGVVPPAVTREEVQATYVANIRHAAQRLQKVGMQVLIEPLSPGTVAGCFLTGSAQAVQVIEEIGAPNVRLQYDLFHMQMLEGNLAATVERLLPRIGHIQLADVPGRHEPGSGEINFEFMLRHIDRIGYSGWIGCEYNPVGDTLEGLKWAKPYL